MGTEYQGIMEAVLMNTHNVYYYEDRHGYLVRIMRGGKFIAKFFSAARYGDELEAFAAAVMYRDACLAEINGEGARKRRFEGEPHIYPRPDGYRVSITRARKQHTRFFARTTYDGDEAALLAAIAWRDEMLATLPKSKRVVVRERRAERLERLEAEAFLRHRVEGLLTEAEIEYLQQKHRQKADQAVSDARNAVSGVLQRYGIDRAS